MSLVSAPSLTRERQEHLDAVVSFAGAGQRRRLFRGLDTLHSSGRQETCQWIRSLTEAQELTTDVPEDSVEYDQQEVDPKKVQPTQMGEFLRKYVKRRLLALSEGEIAAMTTLMRQIGVGGAEALAIFHQLLR